MASTSRPARGAKTPSAKEAAAPEPATPVPASSAPPPLETTEAVVAAAKPGPRTRASRSASTKAASPNGAAKRPVALKPAEDAEFLDRDQDALEVLAEVDGLDVLLEAPDDPVANEPAVSAAFAKASARRAAQGAQHAEKSAQRVSPRPRSTNAPPEGEFERLFAQWRATGDPALRDRLILMHRNLVTYLARRFTDRGEMYEDIIQQGLIGLINALDHFDATRGVRFATFATPTIVGEIRRYFRDKTWSVRVPRRLQELHQTINKRIEALTQELDRSPTYAEIARALGVEEEDVVEAMEMSQALDPTSLDETTGSDENGSAPIADQVGGEDANLERVNEFSQLQDALQQLTPRQQTVLKLAYFEGFSQAEIAKEIKVSPMHVSRLQRRALSQLREVLEDMEELERKRGR